MVGGAPGSVVLKVVGFIGAKAPSAGTSTEARVFPKEESKSQKPASEWSCNDVYPSLALVEKSASCAGE